MTSLITRLTGAARTKNAVAWIALFTESEIEGVRRGSEPSSRTHATKRQPVSGVAVSVTGTFSK